MTGIRSIYKPHFAPGDLAVDGIFMGIEAGIIMAFFLVLVTLRHGLTPVQVLASFSFQQPASLAQGAITHLSVSSIYGILFSLSTGFVRRMKSSVFRILAGVVSGLAYGSLLWVVAEFLVFDSIGVLLRDLPIPLLAMAHLIYGLTLGLLVQSRLRSSAG